MLVTITKKKRLKAVWRSIAPKEHPSRNSVHRSGGGEQTIGSGALKIDDQLSARGGWMYRCLARRWLAPAIGLPAERYRSAGNVEYAAAA